MKPRKKKTVLQRIPESINEDLSKVSNALGIPKSKALNVFTEDNHIIDMKRTGGGKNRFLEITYKKRFKL
jgi:hypothetical protein